MNSIISNVPQEGRRNNIISNVPQEERTNSIISNVRQEGLWALLYRGLTLQHCNAIPTYSLCAIYIARRGIQDIRTGAECTQFTTHRRINRRHSGACLNNIIINNIIIL